MLPYKLIGIVFAVACWIVIGLIALDMSFKPTGKEVCAELKGYRPEIILTKCESTIEREAHGSNH